nr:acetylcholinesterase-like [Lytechinus pictus]
MQLTWSVVVLATVYTGLNTPTLSAAEGGDRPTVQTTSATIRGERRSIHHRQLGADFQKNVAVFKNIPYAEPPIGDLRYAEPVPKNVEGEFDATGLYKLCPQFKNPLMYDDTEPLEFSEDCLYLDVFVPEPKPKSAAVMVWIHGGGYHFGTKNLERLNAMPLVAVEDVIVVSINYRLGILGFLSTEDGAIPGNLGLLDQRQALLWVKENIAAFGGDPDRVTIFGESAGSGSVNCHLLSSMSRGLFSGAIMQSGAMSLTWTFKTPKANAELTLAFGKAMECETDSSTELLTCLRGKSEEDIKALLDTGTSAMLYLVAPVADGHFLPVDPLQAQEDGLFNPSKVMIGSLGNEGTVFTIPMMFGLEGYDKLSVNKTMFDAYTSQFTRVTDQLILDMISLTYLSGEQLTSDDDELDLSDRMAQFFGDIILLCPTYGAAEQLAAAGIQTYTYYMTHVPTYSIWGRQLTWLKDTHAEDIPYVFGSAFLSQDGEEEREDEDWRMRGRLADDEVVIARRIMKYWANFAKSGNPNHGSNGDQETDSQFPSWPLFTIDTKIYKNISNTMGNLSGTLPNSRECYFVEKLLPKMKDNVDEIARLKSLLDEKVSDDSEMSCEDQGSCPEE